MYLQVSRECMDTAREEIWEYGGGREIVVIIELSDNREETEADLSLW